MTFCKNCGSELSQDGKFCPKCGATNESPPYMSRISRPTGITILAVLQLIAGIILVLAAIGMGAVSTMWGMNGMPNMGTMNGMPNMPSFGPMTPVIGGFIAIFFAILAVFAFIISGALFSGKRWGRTLVIIFSIIDLIIGAVSIAGGNITGIGGMILNLVILYYMWRPHVIAYFHR